VRIWGEAITGLQLTRSRPYQKNDNRFVEQKNDTLVRAYLGQARLDTAEQCAALNALYDQMWVYYNLFQPVLHLIEKTHDGIRTRRRWDHATTPFARLLATNTLDPASVSVSNGSMPGRTYGHSDTRSRPGSTTCSIPDRPSSHRPQRPPSPHSRLAQPAERPTCGDVDNAGRSPGCRARGVVHLAPQARRLRSHHPTTFRKEAGHPTNILI
jgi:hypothetical protein